MSVRPQVGRLAVEHHAQRLPGHRAESPRRVAVGLLEVAQDGRGVIVGGLAEVGVVVDAKVRMGDVDPLVLASQAGFVGEPALVVQRRELSLRRLPPGLVSRRPPRPGRRGGGPPQSRSGRAGARAAPGTSAPPPAWDRCAAQPSSAALARAASPRSRSSTAPRIRRRARSSCRLPLPEALGTRGAGLGPTTPSSQSPRSPARPSRASDRTASGSAAGSSTMCVTPSSSTQVYTAPEAGRTRARSPSSSSEQRTGISSEGTQRVLIASPARWASSGSSSLSIASATAPREPGSTKTTRPEASPASARESSAADPISW